MTYGIVYQTGGGRGCGRRRTVIYKELFNALWRAQSAAEAEVSQAPCVMWARTVNLETGWYIDEYDRRGHIRGPGFEHPAPVSIINRFDRMIEERQFTMRNPFKNFPNLLG